MSLPVVAAPIHEVKLLSQKQPVQFRPYLVKEEKLLMMAHQGEDAKEVERAVKQLIRACTFDKLNVEKLPTFDLEYLFLQLRAKSVNNVIDVKFECQNTVVDVGTEPRKCGTIVPVSINLDDVKLTVPEGHTNTYWIGDNLGVSFQYPNADLIEKFAGPEPPSVVDMIRFCLETVFTKDGEVFEVKEQTPDEIETFINSLTVQHVDMLRNFFDTMPRLTHTFTFKCPKCQYQEDVTLEGLADFFD